MARASRYKTKENIHGNYAASVSVTSREIQADYGLIVTILELCLGAVILWSLSLKDVDLRAMNDLGLIAVLPLTFFLALGMLVISFSIVLHQERIRMPLILLHLFILVMMLYGTAAIVEKIPRTAIAWKLAGLISFIRETGSVDPMVDAFNNWPGFFILIAFISDATGLVDPLALATWTPVILNLLYLGPLVMIFRAGSNNQKLVWLGVWFFYLTNWVGQDYLSPQGFSYFIYLVILGILLTWFKSTPEQPEWFFQRWLRNHLPGSLAAKARRYLSPLASSLPDQPSQAWQRVGLLAITVVLFAAIVPSHQLTPFAILAALSTLVIFNRLTARGLPVLMAVLTGLWISYMTVPFLSGHIDEIIRPLGSLGENVNANLLDRFQGSAQHLFILQMRIFTTLLLLVMAWLGGVRQLGSGRLDLSYAILAIVPFSLVGLQVYGGEVLLRSYLFALPFLVYYSAAAFFPAQPTHTKLPTTLAIAATGLALAIGFFFTRHGNERMDYFTPQEVHAVRELYNAAEPGSQLLAVTDFLPWRYQDYASYRYETIWSLAKDTDLAELATLMNDEKYPNSYLILTRSQQASAELFIGWPPETWESFEKALLDSNEFELFYANEDASIFTTAKKEAMQTTSASGQ